MRSSVRFGIILWYIYIAFVSGSSAWFQEELELFDLVEEVNENFYSVMQVAPDASNADLKKSFRKLSLSLHPDKNDAADASVKFRQMVAVYEVLKDAEKRRRYDQILREGLPNWRQPIFYFRRARKMGMGELAVFLSVLLTIGHYLMRWGSYLEKCWALSEIRQKKKKKKSKVKGDDDDHESDEIELSKPGWRTLLPFIAARSLYDFVKSLPARYESYKELKQNYEELKRKEMEAAAAAERVVREPRPKKKRVHQFPEFESMPGREFLERKNEPVSDEEETAVEERSGGLWTDEDIAKLIKMMKKYPGAVSGRWEIIARQMQRTVYEVTFMANRIKRGGACVPEPNLIALQSEASGGHQLVPAETLVTDDPNEVEDEDGMVVQYAQKPAEYEVVERKKKEKHKPVDVAPVGAPRPWSQVQQEALEKALHKYAKGVDERWEKIANCVPGKTKEECLERCRELAKKLKTKKGDGSGGTDGEQMETSDS